MPRKRPVEYSILYTATLCLLAGGAVMVYSASSAESLLSGPGDPAYYLKRYVMFGLAGLVLLHLASRHGLKVIRALTPLLLAGSFALTVAAMLPGIGVTVNGATRWIGAGAFQFQPSELLKVSIVLYGAQLLAARPESVRTVATMTKPLLLVVAAACALLMKQPDMGTTMVVCFAVGAILIAAGTPMRNIALIGGTLLLLATILAIVEPYRRERLFSFVDPFADAGDSGFQAVQALTAIGHGGVFGVGLGESVQKIFYLPEAHTDMILAVISEELGLFGILGLLSLYGMIGYAGLRVAKLARDRYSKLLAAGITSLILCQATLNFFAVLGLMPLTGVPLPFVSYGSSNLVVLLGAMGLLLNVAATGGAPPRRPPRRPRPAAGRGKGRGRLRALAGERDDEASRDRGRRHGGARGARARDRRRATG